MVDFGAKVGTFDFFEGLGVARSEGRGNIDILPDAETARRVWDFEEDEVLGGVERAVVRTSESRGIEAATLPSAPEVSGTSHT